MNRLVIIGNGFDLAHGYKTNYSDFLLDYLKNCVKSVSGQIGYEDPLLTISNRMRFKFQNYTIDEIIDVNRFNYFLKDIGLNITKSSIFYNEIIESLSNLNWVDIETIYFKLLRENSNNPKEIKALNSELEYLKNKLKEYLINLPLNPVIRKDLFVDVFTEDVKKDDIVLEKLDSDKPVENIHFLNFNYTDTVCNYISEAGKKVKNIEVNFIHGELGNINNPIVFGFGDEMDEEFLKFEKTGNNDLFHHIKSFAYSKTNNYQNLVRFLESEDYQVCLFGHSCGLSDRTMLNYIFEHDHCKSIKIYYHQINAEENDFKEKTFQIYRHFRDKSLMRLKIVTEENSRSHPRGVTRK